MPVEPMYNLPIQDYERLLSVANRAERNKFENIQVQQLNIVDSAKTSIRSDHNNFDDQAPGNLTIGRAGRRPRAASPPRRRRRMRTPPPPLAEETLDDVTANEQEVVNTSDIARENTEAGGNDDVGNGSVVNSADNDPVAAAAVNTSSGNTNDDDVATPATGKTMMELLLSNTWIMQRRPSSRTKSRIDRRNIQLPPNKMLQTMTAAFSLCPQIRLNKQSSTF